MKTQSLGILAASAASLLASSFALGAPTVTKDKDGKEWYCTTTSAGQSKCAGFGNASCAGQNKEAGHGWLDASSKEDCDKAKGKWAEVKAEGKAAK